MRHLEELDRGPGTDQQTSASEGRNNISDIQTGCDSTVPEEPGSGGLQGRTSSATVADDARSQQKRMNSSSSSSGVVTTGTSLSPGDSESLENKSQADENHNTELSGEVSSLKAEVDRLRADLRHSDNMLSLLKRHIQLNTAADGSAVPSFNADVIIALAQEVERLNAELGKHQVASDPAGVDDVPAASDEHHGAVKQVKDQCTSPQSMLGLDLTVSDTDTAAIDSRVRQKSASVDNLCDEPRGKLPTKDSLLGRDEETAGRRTTKTAHSLSVSASSVAAEGDVSFLGTPTARHVLRQSGLLVQSPFESTNAANQRAFAELQAEVERLRRRLELTELENSRLLERSVRESTGSFAPSRSSVNPQADMSLSLDGSLVKYSPSGDVMMAAGFLKKLVNVSRRVQ